TIGTDLSRLEKCSVLVSSIPCRVRDDALAVWVRELDLVMIAVGDEDAEHDRVVLLHSHEGWTELVRRHLPALRRTWITLAGPLIRICVREPRRVDLRRGELVGRRRSLEFNRGHVDRVRLRWRSLGEGVAATEQRAHHQRDGGDRSHQPPPVTPRIMRSSN